jgi:tetratricopeptide (TPR) repeat protein
MNKLAEMKRFSLTFLLCVITTTLTVFAQVKTDYSKIDLMLIRGDYAKVIDTCQLILKSDSLNPEIYYKKGLAYQNYLPDDKSFDCFLRASSLDPGNKLYKFMVARGYFAKGKIKQARLLLESLCSTDTLNWSYAYYLTSIYMQEKKYEESLKIYQRFYDRDPLNYVFLDKIGFAYLRMGFYPTAIEYYNKSLAIYPTNISSIKNLSFLYASTLRADTALKLLTKGIGIDSTDIDLYIRRAALNYSYDNNKEALDDYLKILTSGDSTLLYIKRAGIGYTIEMKPKPAIDYLLIAFKKDSSDFEVCKFLAYNYQKINYPEKSAHYYGTIIRNLDPMLRQLSFGYVSLAEIQKSEGRYKESVDNYLKGQKYLPDMNIDMILANLYDQKMNDIPKALYYYQLFIDTYKNTKKGFSKKYIETIQMRVDYLKEQQRIAAKK